MPRISARSAWWRPASSGWRPRCGICNAREVREAEEFFHPGQKGSSAMPHKRNPVLSENLTGLARVVRAAVMPALENVALWHERDISHSSVERAIAPDATVTLDFALSRLAGMMRQLVVYPERMAANLEVARRRGAFRRGAAGARAGRHFARGRLSDRAAGNAMATWTQLGTPSGRSFRANLDADPEVAARVSAAELNAATDARLHLTQLDTIFTRVFGEAGPKAA